MSHDDFTCPTCGHKHNEQACPKCVSRLIGTQASLYRTHLVTVANNLHRKMTGLNTGSSRYKGLYGRWCQAQEDLVAWENLCGGESASGGPRLAYPGG